MTKQNYCVGLRCFECGQQYGLGEPIYRCHKCGSLLDPQYDYEAIRGSFSIDEIRKRPNTIWRWRELLPIIDFSKHVTLGEGGSPLLKCDKIAKAVGVKELFIKDDAVTQPTGSLKDRAMAVAVTKAIEFGFDTISADSTGNKAAAAAAYAAKAGLNCIVFVDRFAPLQKLVQILIYGARLVRVDAEFADVSSLHRNLVHDAGMKWFDCGKWNPYRCEGKKTYAYEVAESFNWERVPDVIVHPSAGSLSIVRTWKGYNELKYELGLIEGKLPRMVCVQSEKCAPIVEAFLNNKKVERVKKGNTIAQSIASSDPGQAGELTARVLRESGGTGVTVTDEEIIWGMEMLGSEGIFAEPSSFSQH